MGAQEVGLVLNGGNQDGLPKDAFEHGLEEALGACKGITRGRRTSEGTAGPCGVIQNKRAVYPQMGTGIRRMLEKIQVSGSLCHIEGSGCCFGNEFY